MKIFSTRNFLTKTFGAMALVLTGSSVFAQATFTVDAPATLAGERAVTIGQWGQNDINTTITGEIVLAVDADDTADANRNPGSFNDACSALTNAGDIAGKIVMVDRTVICNSIDAAANTSGMIAMVVCASADYTANIHPIGASLENYLDMPVFGMDQVDCDAIKMALGAGETVNGTYLIDCTQAVPENVVWGAGGEGDFSEEGDGWEVAGDGWRYDPDGYVARGNFNGSFGYARTRTSCNGSYVFDADFLDNGGQVDADGNALFGTGDCPSFDFEAVLLDPPCVSSLTSPTIDLSGATGNSFALVFDQVIRDNRSVYQLEVSVDGGTTYTTTEINTDIPVNGPHFTETEIIPLVGVDKTSQLVVRFTERGGYYYWAVDDVFIIEQATVDVQGNENFFATAPNFRTPVSQLDFHPFLIDVQNFGNADANDVVITATIADAAGTELFSATRDYNTVEAGTIDENQAFDDSFDMEGLDVGTYTTTYSTSASNNTAEAPTRSSTWQITNDVFSKVISDAEAGVAYLGNWGLPDASFISHGNFFHVANDGYEAVSVRTGVAPQNAGEAFIGEVLIEMYEWNDDNGDSLASPDERILVGTGFVEIESTEADAGDKEVILEAVSGDRVVLEGGKDYLVMAHLAPLDPPNYDMRFKAAGIDDNRDFYYTPMRFAATALGAPRYGTMTSLAGAAFDDIDTRTFNEATNLSSYLPLTIAKIPTGTEDINEDITFSIFPNPASDFINIAMDLNEVSETVNITLTDVKGQVAYSENFKNIQKNTIKISTDIITPGAYVANIRTDAGFTSQKVMIVK